MGTIMSQEVGGVRRYCNSRCHNAKKPHCACICKGKYHGINRSAERLDIRTIDEAEAIKQGATLDQFRGALNE